MTLAGKVALVTGAGHGIGRAIAAALAEAGADIAAADVDAAAAAETAGAAEKLGRRGLALAADVGSVAAVDEMVRGVAAAFGRIDVLVNNAALYGGLKGGRFTDLPEAEWDACMSVNVKGMWQCCKAVVGAMKQAGGGSIINISSLAATFGLPFALHYTTSKGAVIGLTLLSKPYRRPVLARAVRQALDQK